MNTTIKLALTASLAALSLAAAAADPSATTTREQRMDDALQNYRAAHPGAAQAPAAKSEAGVKGGIQRTGAAIERGAERAGNAVRRGLEKTGEAAHRVGDKISSKVNGEKAP